MKTTKAIGFGGTFYTLWEITTELCYTTNALGQHFASHERKTFTYIKNISTSEQKAQELHPGLAIDLELKGTKSWWVDTKTVCDLPVSMLPFMAWGKYEGRLVTEIDDLSYLGWYYGQTGNRYAKAVLLATGELFEVVNEDGVYYIDKREFERRKAKEASNNVIDAMAQTGEVYKGAVLTNVFNVLEARHEACAKIKVEVEGKPLVFNCEDYKVMEYQGVYYGLPLVNGVAKRVKGKTISFTVHANQEHGAFINILEVLK